METLMIRTHPAVRADPTARWRRHYAVRTAIGLTLVYAVWVLYSQWDWNAARGRGGPVRPGDARALPGFAELCFLEFAWVQGLAILLVVPGLVAGSIAEEDRGGTMVGLLASPLSSGAIVLGKLGGGWYSRGGRARAAARLPMALWTARRHVANGLPSRPYAAG
jgi:hypothetical protein